MPEWTKGILRRVQPCKFAVQPFSLKVRAHRRRLGERTVRGLARHLEEAACSVPHRVVDTSESSLCGVVTSLSYRGKWTRRHEEGREWEERAKKRAKLGSPANVRGEKAGRTSPWSRHRHSLTRLVRYSYTETARTLAWFGCSNTLLTGYLLCCVSPPDLLFWVRDRDIEVHYTEHLSK